MDLVNFLQKNIKEKLIKNQKTFSTVYTAKNQLDVYAHIIDEHLIAFEFELIPEKVDTDISFDINVFMQILQKAKDVNEMGNLCCKAIRRLSGYERVMLYRFFPPTMYGQVIAEDKVASASSFLDHRFPATDIPKPARDLYLKNQIRYIHDSHSKVYDIFPKFDSEHRPLNMSESRLRGVSFIHIEYLKNMGVGGSFSVAVIINGELWGLFACHHTASNYISHQARSQCLTVANAMALSAANNENFDFHAKHLKFNLKLNELFTNLKEETQPLEKMFRNDELIRDIFSCEGFAYVTDKKVKTFGVTPLAKEITKIWKVIFDELEKTNRKVFFTDNLGTFDESFVDFKDQASGVLAIRLSLTDDSMLILMRPEYLETILWGGDPRKNLEARNYKGVINPRASFDSWAQVIHNQSKPWKDFEVKGITIFKDLIFDSLILKEHLILELTKSLKTKS
jgi:light-regulated signal transduction histidine kinase (bacteriophytochrome)